MTRLQAEAYARPATTAELLDQLITAIHTAYTTPPDIDPLRTIHGRVAAYGRLRDRGYTRKQAAHQVGVCYETARRYDIRLSQHTESR